MVSVTVPFKAVVANVVDSLFIVAPIVFVCLFVMSLFCCAVLGAVLVIIPLWIEWGGGGGGSGWLLFFNCFLMSRGCWCTGSYLHDAVGWSALSDCGISWTHFIFMGIVAYVYSTAANPLAEHCTASMFVISRFVLPLLNDHVTDMNCIVICFSTSQMKTNQTLKMSLIQMRS